ncbi:MAG: hypothetical protein HP496_15430 [Nitrospira sp.]|nr:hypothetical protein [Nitrospira sp.]
MYRKRMVIPVFGLVLLQYLSACSGAGDTAPPSPAPLPTASAEGLWTGTTDTNRTIAGLVLDNGVYWILYSVVGNPSTVAGLVQGDSSLQNGVLTSSNAKDFNFEAGEILDATINGSHTTKQSLTGTLAYVVGRQSTSFTTAYDSAYDLIPDMNAIAGTYIGPVTTTEDVTVQVSSNGDISGKSTTGCTFTGSFSPRTHGNVYDVTIAFGPQDACSNKSSTVRGVGFYDAEAKRLTSAALNGTRTNGFIFIGTKP